MSAEIGGLQAHIVPLHTNVSSAQDAKAANIVKRRLGPYSGTPRPPHLTCGGNPTFHVSPPYHSPCWTDLWYRYFLREVELAQDGAPWHCWFSWLWKALKSE